MGAKATIKQHLGSLMPLRWLHVLHGDGWGGLLGAEAGQQGGAFTVSSTPRTGK